MASVCFCFVGEIWNVKYTQPETSHIECTVGRSVTNHRIAKFLAWRRILPFFDMCYIPLLIRNYYRLRLGSDCDLTQLEENSWFRRKTAFREMSPETNRIVENCRKRSADVNWVAGNCRKGRRNPTWPPKIVENWMRKSNLFPKIAPNRRSVAKNSPESAKNRARIRKENPDWSRAPEPC